MRNIITNGGRIPAFIRLIIGFQWQKMYAYTERTFQERYTLLQNANNKCLT